MRPFLHIVTLAVTVIFSYAALEAADPDISQLEGRAAQVEKRLAGLLKEKRDLETRSESLAEEIADLKMKSGDGLSIFNRYRLDAKLRESKEMADKLQECESEINAARKDYRELAVSLDRLYTKSINDLLAQFGQTITNDMAGKLSELYSLRNSWREKVPERSTGALILFDVQLDSLDGPREIREKADLVRDMEEEVRTKRQLLEKKVNDLKDEKKIREKMGDFLQEVTLFGDRERGRRDDQTLSENIPAIADIALEGADRFSKLDGLSSSQTVTRDQVFRFWETVETLDPANLSSQNIDQIIGQYQKIIDQLAAKADELHNKAQSFYKKSEDYNQ